MLMFGSSELSLRAFPNSTRVFCGDTGAFHPELAWDVVVHACIAHEGEATGFKGFAEGCKHWLLMHWAWRGD